MLLMTCGVAVGMVLLTSVAIYRMQRSHERLVVATVSG